MVRRRSMLTAVLSTVAGILILVSGCSDRLPLGLSENGDAALQPSGLIGTSPRIITFSRGRTPGTYTTVIDQDGGVLRFGVGEIRFPEGAVDGSTRIAAKIDGRSLSVEFQPHGLIFPEHARPTLEFSLKQIPIPARAAIVYLDESGVIREIVGGRMNAARTIMTGSIGHFSAYTIATF